MTEELGRFPVVCLSQKGLHLATGWGVGGGMEMCFVPRAGLAVGSSAGSLGTD